MSMLHIEFEAPRTLSVPALSSRLGSLATAFAGARQAHQRRVRHAAMTTEILDDIVLTAEEATGLPSRQPDLPFFMQSGFGRR